MTDMCESCPNRAMANLNRSLGNETEAVRIESAGCGWWWGLNYKNEETGVTKVIYGCGKEHVAKLICDQGAIIVEALQTAQSTRNEINLGLAAIAIRLIPTVPHESLEIQSESDAKQLGQSTSITSLPPGNKP